MIAYISEVSCEKTIHDDVQNIISTAKKHNKLNNITGALFYSDGFFLQIIEGDKDQLKSLMANIEKDPRHSNVEYLLDTEIESRSYQAWSMDSLQVKSGNVFNAETMRRLTDDFTHNFMPRTDMLIHYYKTFLEEKKYLA